MCAFFIHHLFLMIKILNNLKSPYCSIPEPTIWRYLLWHQSYLDVPDYHTLAIGVQEVVPFRISAQDFGHAPFHVWQAGKHALCRKRPKKKSCQDKFYKFYSINSKVARHRNEIQAQKNVLLRTLDTDIMTQSMRQACKVYSNSGYFISMLR